MYDLLRTVYCFARKACEVRILGLALFFERKIVDFPFKKQRQSDRFSLCAPLFRRKKQCVVRLGNLLCIHTF